jgi:hypothetical protein
LDVDRVSIGLSAVPLARRVAVMVEMMMVVPGRDRHEAFSLLHAPE